MYKLKEFKPKQVKEISDISVITFLGVTLLGYFCNSLLISIIGLIFILCSVIFNITLYRCPKCGKYLGRFRMNCCKHCGNKLE